MSEVNADIPEELQVAEVVPHIERKVARNYVPPPEAPSSQADLVDVNKAQRVKSMKRDKDIAEACAKVTKILDKLDQLGRQAVIGKLSNYGKEGQL